MNREALTAAIGAHFSKLLGGQPRIHRGVSQPPIELDFLIYPAHDKRPWTAVVTAGMSALAQNVPAAAEEFRHVELCFMLPPDWPTDAAAMKDPRYSWPFLMCEGAARWPHMSGAPLALGHTMDLGFEGPKRVIPGTAFSSAITLPTFARNPDHFALSLPDRRIMFLMLVPLYPEERDLKLRRGERALLDALESDNLPITELMDPARPNACRLRADRADAGTIAPTHARTEPSAGHDDGVVILDRLCRRCMHDLRGHTRGGVCANCGTRVAESLDYAHYVQRSPWLVNRLIRGGRLVLWGNALAPFVAMAMFGFASAMRQHTWIIGAGVTALCVIEMAIHAGWWKLTMADPDARDKKLLTARYVLRATVICSAALLALNMLVVGNSLASPPPPNPAPRGPTADQALAALVWGLYLVVCLIRAVVARMYCHWLIVLSNTDRTNEVPDYRFRWYQIIFAIILPWHLVIEPIWMLTAVADVISRLKQCRRARARIVERISLHPQLAEDHLAEREGSVGVIGAAV